MLLFHKSLFEAATVLDTNDALDILGRRACFVFLLVCRLERGSLMKRQQDRMEQTLLQINQQTQQNTGMQRAHHQQQNAILERLLARPAAPAVPTIHSAPIAPAPAAPAS